MRQLNIQYAVYRYQSVKHIWFFESVKVLSLGLVYLPSFLPTLFLALELQFILYIIDFTRNHKILKKSSPDFDQYHIRQSQVRYAKVTIAASVLCENLEKVWKPSKDQL